jgi:hypothetical protein
VVIDRRKDPRLETERIRYTKENDRLHGEVPFVLESDGGRTIMEGAGFESDPGLDEVHIVEPSGRSAPGPDSLLSATDSLGAEGQPSQTEAAPAGGVPPDSTRLDSTVSDTTATPDSSLVAPDSGVVASDSTVQDTVTRDSTPARPDSTVQNTTRRDTTSSSRFPQQVRE